MTLMLLRPDLFPASWQWELSLLFCLDHVPILLLLILLLRQLLRPGPPPGARAAAAAGAAPGVAQDRPVRAAPHAAPQGPGAAVEACGRDLQGTDLEGAEAVRTVPVQEEVHLGPRHKLVPRLHIRCTDVDFVLMLLKHGSQLLADVLDGHCPAEGAFPFRYSPLDTPLAQQLRRLQGSRLFWLLWLCRGWLLHWPLPCRGFGQRVPVVPLAVISVKMRLPAVRKWCSCLGLPSRLDPGVSLYFQGICLLLVLLNIWSRGIQLHLVGGLLGNGLLLCLPLGLLAGARGLRRPHPRGRLRGPVPVVPLPVLLAPDRLPPLGQRLLLDITRLWYIHVIGCRLLFQILRIRGLRKLFIRMTQMTTSAGPLPFSSTLPI
mmetsp:Transcript_34794/g.99970  ORF Transcript_34794/g.99970 Transcript_34794/m.99970 type:complete len:375 (+) Transcript_34794:334-1458(+)